MARGASRRASAVRRWAAAPNVASLDELLRRSRARFGGPAAAADCPAGPTARSFCGRSSAWSLLWLVFTTIHSISPGERGVVTRFGRYSRTLGPGVSFTLPSPIDRVKKIDVENIRTVDLGSDDANDLMLTGDQNLIDIAYSVRWNIRTPELYLFQLAQPDDTIREVAESAMRAVVSRSQPQRRDGRQARARSRAQVAENMQRILDAYRSGIQVQGVAIKQADPPDAVNDAFKEVTAAQQEAQVVHQQGQRLLRCSCTARRRARRPRSTRSMSNTSSRPTSPRERMYYETMEQVLSKVDKTIVEAPGVTPYLPLPQVQKSAQQQEQQQ